MKKYSVIAFASLLAMLCFTGCGKNNNSSSANPVVTSKDTIQTTAPYSTEKNNPDFDDLDKNTDGILDDEELKKDSGNNIMTVIDDVVTVAENIISDVVTGAENIVSDVVE